MSSIRYNWTKQEIETIYNKPLLPLMLEAADMHRQHHTFGEVQVSSLLSIKTGGCSEDCAYCPQAARYHTGIEVQALMKVDEVVEKAVNTENETERRALYLKAQKLVFDDVATLPLWYEVQVAIMKKDIEGFEPSIMGDYDTLVNVVKSETRPKANSSLSSSTPGTASLDSRN